MTIKEEIVQARNSETYSKLSKYYQEKSLMQIAGVSRLETAHSQFIAWLLDPTRNTLGTIPLKKLFALIALAYDREENKDVTRNSELLTHLCSGDYTIDDIKNDTEYSIDNKTGKKGRIDIYVVCTIQIASVDLQIPLVIENKVLSKERDDQTNRYCRWGLKQYKGENYVPIFVYLSPFTDDEIGCSEFLRISYQDLIDYVLEPCRDLATDERTKAYLKDYLRCLSFDEMAINDENQKNKNLKGELIMGYSKEEKELLQQFWEQNKDLLYAVASAIEDDDEDAVKTKEQLTKALTTRDYSKYVYNGNEYSKRGFVEAVIRDYFAAHPAKNIQEARKVFGDLIIDQAKRDSDPTRAAKNPIDFSDGMKAYISNQVGKHGQGMHDIDEFCRTVNNLHIPFKMKED